MFIDMAPNFHHYESENPHGTISLLGNDDESEWLHTCDAYQIQAKPGGMRPNLIATDLGECTMVPQTYISLDTPGAREIGSKYLGMTRDPETPINESTMEHVSTSADLHVQESFLLKSADSEKRQQHCREMYSLMTDEQSELCLRKNREYKRCRRETSTFFDHDGNVAVTGGSTITPRSTSAMQAQSSSKNN